MKALWAKVIKWPCTWVPQKYPSAPQYPSVSSVLRDLNASGTLGESITYRVSSTLSASSTQVLWLSHYLNISIQCSFTLQWKNT